MLQAIIFDFDGVLVDSEPLHYRAFVETVRPLGVTFDYEHYRQHYIGFDDRDAFRAISGEFTIEMDENRINELISSKAAAFARIVSAGITPMPGAVELLREAAATVPVALCSGALAQDISLILPQLGEGGVAGCFKAMVTADDVQRSKPDPQSYVLAAQRLGIAPGNCMAIEDTPAGIASAKAAGLYALGVASSFPAEDLVQADRTVESLSGVSLGSLRSWFDSAAFVR